MEHDLSVISIPLLNDIKSSFRHSQQGQGQEEVSYEVARERRRKAREEFDGRTFGMIPTDTPSVERPVSGHIDVVGPDGSEGIPPTTPTHLASPGAAAAPILAALDAARAPSCKPPPPHPSRTCRSR